MYVCKPAQLVHCKKIFYEEKTSFYFVEGALQKCTSKRLTERYVFLFDGLVILTKQNTRRSSVTGPVGDYKLKEKFNMRKVDIYDREDTDGMLKHYLIVRAT